MAVTGGEEITDEPIRIVPYDPTGPDRFERERAALAEEFRDDREAYTEAKTEFIRATLGYARPYAIVGVS